MDSDPKENKTNENFYSKAVKYWSDIPATVNGMLGGFGEVSEIDIRDSRCLLKELFHSHSPPGRNYALDCGAGIGRVSKHLLAHFFNKVDLVEQNPKFLEQAKQYFSTKLQNKIGTYYCVGLQDFKPERRKYDVIWVQWVLGHLTDQDLKKFLQSCEYGLKSTGILIIKENVASSEEIDTDEIDSSLTRPISAYRDLFRYVGFDCYRQVKQRDFPEGLYTVYMFVLKPIVSFYNAKMESLEEQERKDIICENV